MPKFNWIRKLFNKEKKKKLYRTHRMPSFKLKKVNRVNVKAYDLQGNDITSHVKHSYVYNGVPGGFYLDNQNKPVY